MKKINIFVPGRLCLFGEHSDWASEYRTIDDAIEKGYAIVSGIEEGIYAEACSDALLCINDGPLNYSVEMDINKLKNIAKDGGYWSYLVGVAAVVKEKYDVGGIKLNILDKTLPMKKGLSSSAAICVLCARAFNKVYNLNLSIDEEMELAYLGERLTPSKCGRLDQACAYGKQPVLLEFDGNKVNKNLIKVGGDFYFVFADLKSSKNTTGILNDLNEHFLNKNSKYNKNLRNYLGFQNNENVLKAKKYLEAGDSKGLGMLMKEAQKGFDDYVSVASKYLEAPLLHKTFKDEIVNKLSYGYKGVGSQGDGTIQFLAKGKKEQKDLVQYLIETLKMDAYEFTLSKEKNVTKAVIPLAGNGTRMFPITKIVKKAFLPIIGKDNIVKPVLMILLEELVDAGIEKIGLVIDREDKVYYDQFFSNVKDDILNKLSFEQKNMQKRSMIFQIK